MISFAVLWKQNREDSNIIIDRSPWSDCVKLSPVVASLQARGATLSRQLETERQQASAVSSALKDEVQGLKVGESCCQGSYYTGQQDRGAPWVLLEIKGPRLGLPCIKPWNSSII